VGALRSLRSKKKLSAEKRQETHFLSNDENEKWNNDHVERVTTVARKRVPDAEAAMMQDLIDMTTADNVGATTGQRENCLSRC